MAILNNIESVFKYHFPKLTVNIEKYAQEIYAEVHKDIVGIRVYKLREDIYFSEVWFANEDFILLHQSTDLNELMQITKQKLNDMFADWMSKVN